jgi:hypothetical protein
MYDSAFPTKPDYKILAESPSFSKAQMLNIIERFSYKIKATHVYSDPEDVNRGGRFWQLQRCRQEGLHHACRGQPANQGA